MPGESTILAEHSSCGLLLAQMCFHIARGDICLEQWKGRSQNFSDGVLKIMTLWGKLAETCSKT